MRDPLPIFFPFPKSINRMPHPDKARKTLNKLKVEASLYIPRFKSFLSQYTGLSIDTVLVIVLFFALGLPNVIVHGYPLTTNLYKWCITVSVTHSIQHMKQNSEGGIASGVYGTGVFPVSLLLFIIVITFFVKELVLVVM